jgi:acyl-CoA thioesterase I
MKQLTSSIALLLTTQGCGGALEGEILVIGDSVFAFHAEDDRGIANVIAEELGREVADASVGGAYLTADGDGDDIRHQYEEGDWTWLVMDGGGNDVNDECSCTACESNIDSLISSDGTRGALPTFARDVLDSGVRIAFMGYYLVPDNAEFGFHLCNDEVASFRERLVLWADDEADVIFVDAAEVISPDDRANYAEDNVHPSESGSRVLGTQLAEAIRNADAAR